MPIKILSYKGKKRARTRARARARARKGRHLEGAAGASPDCFVPVSVCVPVPDLYSKITFVVQYSLWPTNFRKTCSLSSLT